MPEVQQVPDFLPVNFDNIPEILKQRCKWAVWEAVMVLDSEDTPKRDAAGNLKWGKVPHNGAYRISTANPAQWGTFEQAKALYLSQPGRFQGVTLLVEKGDLVFVDWDAKGMDAKFIQELKAFWPSYLEQSPSGAGFRGVYIGTYSDDRTEPFEVYTGVSARHLTFTGQVVDAHTEVTPAPTADAWLNSLPAQKPKLHVVKTTHPPIPDPPPVLPEQYIILGYGVVPDPGTRNEQFARVVSDLFRHGMPADQIFGWAVSSDWLPLYAIDKRNGPQERGVQFLWEEIERITRYQAQQVASRVLVEPATAPAQEPSSVPEFLTPPAPAAGQPAQQPLQGEVLPRPAAATPQGTLGDLIEEADNLGYEDSVEALLAKTLVLNAVDSERVMKAIASRTNVTLTALKQDRQRLARQQVTVSQQPKHPFYSDYVWVESIGKFYRQGTNYFVDQQTFGFTWGHVDEECLQRAREGSVQRVARLDFAPGEPTIFREGPEVLGDHSNLVCNTWTGLKTQGVEGDVSWWLNHYDVMGYTAEERKHHLQYLAFTLRYPGIKINHALVACGPPGCGKNWMWLPVIRALGEKIGGGGHAPIIEGEELSKQFNSYIASAKVVLFNESQMEGNRDMDLIGERIKRLTATPPETLSVEFKGKDPFSIRNVVNILVTANSRLPLPLQDGDRRTYASWTDYSPKDSDGVISPEQEAYWQENWAKMLGTYHHQGEVPGWENVVWYLLNGVDLTDFRYASPPPLNDFTRSMMDTGRGGLASLLNTLLDQGNVPAVVTTRQLRNMIIGAGDLMASHGFKLSDPPSVNQISRALHTLSRVRGPEKIRLPQEFLHLKEYAGGEWLRVYVVDRKLIAADVKGAELAHAWAAGVAAPQMNAE